MKAMNQLTKLFFKTTVTTCELFIKNYISHWKHTRTIIQDQLRSINVSMHSVPKMLITNHKI